MESLRISVLEPDAICNPSFVFDPCNCHLENSYGQLNFGFFIDTGSQTNFEMILWISR